MNAKSGMLTLLLLLTPSIAFAEARVPAAGGAPKSPQSAYNKRMYGTIKDILTRSAEKLPEEHYAFRPVDSVRTFGQIVGHIADAQYFFCSAALGEKKPSLKIETTKTSKADLIAALKTAFTYCDRAYERMTDTYGAETVQFMGYDTPKLGLLTTNNVHAIEHYGNLVTYLRIKNLVPPTSEPGFMKPPQSK